MKFSQLAREYNAKSESLFARRSREVILVIDIHFMGLVVYSRL